METKFLIIGFLIIASIQLDAQEERVIKSEAKYYCQCYKSFDKEKRRVEKKAERKAKRDAKPKKYRPGMNVFGGYSLDFSFADCLDKKRSKNSKKYIKSLDDEEKEIFRRKVKRAIKKNVQNIIQIITEK